MRVKAYGIATGLYNKHCKYSEQWNPWHLLRSAHDVQHHESFIRQTKTWIDQHPWRDLDKFKIESFHSADTLQKLLFTLDFGLSENNWIEDPYHIIGTLYYGDIFQCIHEVVAHPPFQAEDDVEEVCLADSESNPLYSQTNMGYWWFDIHDQLPAGTTIVPVQATFDEIELTNFLCAQHG